MIKLLTVFGTRPEAVKLAPVLLRLRDDRRFESRAVNAGQHRRLTAQVLRAFGLRPDYELGVMRRGQSLSWITRRVLEGLAPILEDFRPDAVLVQGDTTTTFSAALAAFYAGVPVVHVEAGLRTPELRSPFPEEGNRRMTSRLAAVHFAPTRENRRNLLREGIPAADIVVTGNTAVDAVLWMRRRAAKAPAPDPARPLLLVTGHRRENFGAGLKRICRALKTLARSVPRLQIVYPVHPNPRVLAPVRRMLKGIGNIRLAPPLDYARFVRLMDRATVVLTDSGGLQEEAPALGKPLLLMRELSERPEALRAKTARLIGTDTTRIVSEVRKVLNHPRILPRRSPFGDGRASERIVAALAARFGKGR